MTTSQIGEYHAVLEPSEACTSMRRYWNGDDYITACRENNLPAVKDVLADEYFKQFKNKQFFLNEGLAASTHNGVEVMHYLLTSPELAIHADINENGDRPLRLAILGAHLNKLCFYAHLPF